MLPTTPDKPRQRAEGGGRKPRHGEPTEPVGVRLPASVCRKLEAKHGTAGTGVVEVLLAWAKKSK